MDDLRYAVGGSPIAHSLSPILFNLVLKDLQNKGHFSKLDVSSITVIDANHIDEVLGWAYIEHDKHQPIWSPANHKLKPFQIRLSHLVEEALEIEPLAGFGPVLETPKRSTRSNTLPARSSSREVWLNLTSPLKHQLQSMVFSPVDDAFDILSVNSLRYSGQGWYCASTDGHGIVNVAYHVGIDVSKGAVLGIHGGGGAARSIASAWSGAGGTVVSLGGRRQLPADLVTGKLNDGMTFDLTIDAEGTMTDTPQTMHSLNPIYGQLDGDLEQLMKVVLPTNTTIDGRWMLAAQHLESWRCLWTPHLSEHLPSLENVMTWLIEVESKLAGN